MLGAAGLHPISHAADGTEVERATQCNVENRAIDIREYVIGTPLPHLKVTIRIFYNNGHPFVSVQDSCHARKTSRNQLFTGAKGLVIGKFIMVFAHLLQFAMNLLSPLFHRDVLNVDRQNDRAATRLFSAAALHQHLELFPHRPALSAYLFVFGELIDAWQNRSIPHIERIQMVLRARFFLMAWQAFVEAHPAYSVNVQFISRESFNIFRTVCDSLISLVLIHRRHYPHYPLLPWLHSTEGIEHVFGLLRQLKKDFTYIDMLYFEPKMRVLMRGSFDTLTADQQLNQTAAGYLHTYFMAPDLDLPALAHWPTDNEIMQAAALAFDEAAELLSVLGVDCKKILEGYQDPPPPKPKSRRSVIAAPRGPQTLAELISLYQYDPRAKLSSHTENELEACKAALVADHIDCTLEM